jgi:hypothetical protein
MKTDYAIGLLRIRLEKNLKVIMSLRHSVHKSMIDEMLLMTKELRYSISILQKNIDAHG